MHGTQKRCLGNRIHRALYLQMQIAGISPYPWPNDKTTCSSFITSLLALWCATVFALSFVATLKDFQNLLENTATELEKLAFHSLLLVATRTVRFARFVFGYLSLIVHSKNIPIVAMSTVLSVHQSKWHKITFAVLIIWTVASTCIIAFSGGMRESVFLKAINFTLSSPTPFFHPTIMIPSGAWSFLSILTNVILYCAYMLPQAMMVSLLIPVHYEFVQINRRLKDLSQEHDLDKGCIVGLVKGEMNKFRRLGCFISRINEIFSSGNLLSSLLELFSWVTMVAAALHQSQRYPEDDISLYDKREREFEGTKTGLYFASFILLGQFIVRMTACILCHEEAQSAANHLDRVAGHCLTDPLDTELQRKFAEYQNEILCTDTSITAGGYFSFTREYLSMLVGSLLTYILLVKGMADAQTDKMDLHESVRRMAESLCSHLV